VVGGDGRLLIERRHLKLARGDLVVTSKHGNAKLDKGRHETERISKKNILEKIACLGELDLGVLHEGEDARGSGAKVVVAVLLLLERLGADDGAASVEEIRALHEVLTIDQEKLLLGANLALSRRGLGVS